jgi:hypothetical protein
MTTLAARPADRIVGVLCRLDCVVITGTFPDMCHADAATRFLLSRKARILDFSNFAQPLRDLIRDHPERVLGITALLSPSVDIS